MAEPREGATPDDPHAPLATAGGEFLLRPGIAFLNHGSFGACPRPVFAVYQRWQHELEEQPVEFLGRRHAGLLAEAQAALAAYLGTQPERLAFVPNATYGMNVVARSLALQPGDEVLLTDHEYGAVTRTWQFICAARGATLRMQPIPLPVTTASDLMERLWAGVTPRTRALVVSHITSPTALIFPVAAICRRAAAEGILTIVDGAHAPGQLDLALDALGADFYTGNCHKWLCAPKGSGFLYARAEAEPLLRPLVVSHGWSPSSEGDAAPLRDYLTWTGTIDPSAYLSVPAAIAFEERHDWPRVRAACHALAAQARARICALSGLPPICPDSPEWFAQMSAAELPLRSDQPAEALREALWREASIEVPIIEWNGRRLLRVSIQVYNCRADVDRLLHALATSSPSPLPGA